jgi:hypothetical protein
MSRRWSRPPSRRSTLTRVGELLTGHAVIWVIGLAVGVTFLIGMSVHGPLSSLLVVIPLVVVAATALVFKDRILILRRRILFMRRGLSRRQFLATTISISIAAALSAVFGWMLGTFILGGYDQQVRQHLTRKPPKK